MDGVVEQRLSVSAEGHAPDDAVRVSAEQIQLAIRKNIDRYKWRRNGAS